MQPKLCLRVCRYYRDDVAHALAELGYTDVVVEAYALACDRPRPQRAATLFVDPPLDHDATLVIGACAIRHLAPHRPVAMPDQLIPLDHCLAMIAGPTLREEAVRTGAYLITPGWLSHWRSHMHQWGFDPPLAREFFRESTSELLLLDTGTASNAHLELAQLAAYVDRPFQVHVVGLDYLKLYLDRTILAWRLAQQEKQMRQVIQQTNRKTAEYAMAFDLLVNLVEIRSEEATIAAIQNMIGMLFGCARPAYGQVRAGQIVRIFARPDAPDEHVWLTQALTALGDDVTLSEADDGFYLRVHYRRETFGLIAVRGIAFPEYRHQYLNLGLAIANLCGLALANARTYSMLQSTEQSLRRERDLTEQLRQTMSDLSSALDHERILGQILSLLDQLIPNQSAMLLLWEADMLRVVSARGHLEESSLVGRQIHADQQPFALVLKRQAPLILGAAALESMPSIELMDDLVLQSWMGVPLLRQRQVIGLLVIGSCYADNYGAEHARSAQVLASEIAIALDQARIVAAAHALAGTDPLTGLYNRRRFSELAENAFRHAQRSGGWLSAIFLDLDHFKQVNDAFSHMAGDQVLIAVATLLRQLRDSEIAARYGGEEFVVISSASDLPAMRQLAERLRRAIASEPIMTLSGPVSITASLGVASITPDLASLGELIWRADQALYAAKAGGRNRICVWGEVL